jgi:excinuclease ABC subunit B
LLRVTDYRRKKQIEYNTQHGIQPTSIRRAVQESLKRFTSKDVSASMVLKESEGKFDVVELLRELQGQMLEASQKLDYEKAALLRDQISELKKQLGLDKLEPAPRPTKSRGGGGRGKPRAVARAS